MKPIQLISQDLFDKVRSRFTNLEMGDETGAVTIDPAQALFFDFDFVNEGVNLGRVSVSLNDLGSLKIYYSQGITENQDDPAKQVWYDFLKEMRLFAMRRLLRFDTRDIAKNNLDKNDFQYLATKGAPKEEEMNMNESKWNNKSSKKTSRAVRGSTEVIVRHGQAVDETFPGSRSQRKNIKAIFIQNKDGERFKYPFVHPAGAFAMAQHVDHGGAPYDTAGKAIIKMSEQIAQLQEFQRKVQHTSLHDDAMGITERAVGRLQELKNQVECLGKRHHYQNWIAEFNQDESSGDLLELDPVTMEDYKSKFTQTSFKEELASFFPLIHSIMREANTVDLEAYVQESTCPSCHSDPCKCDSGTTVKEDEFAQFEEWANATEQGKLTDDQTQELKQALSELQSSGQNLELGPDGQTAWQFFSGLGLVDSDLEEKFKAAADLDPTGDPIEVMKLWAQESYPELLVALGMSDTGEQEPAPEAPPMAPEQPVAESADYDKILQAIAALYGDDVWDNDAMQDLANDLEQAGPSDQELDFIIAKGKLPKRLANIEFTNNDNVQFGNMEEGADDGASMVREVAKIVKSFYNRDNPEVGPFRGGEGIAIDVEKQISEMFGEEAGQQARQMAEMFMEKLTNEWHDRHGAGPVDSGDGLARLKELLGNVKQKVEGISPSDNSSGLGKMKALLDSVKEKIESYAPEMEENGPDKSKIPAVQRKAQGGDWKMTGSDLEKERTKSPTSPEGLRALQQKLGMSEGLDDILRLSGLAK